MRKCSGTSTLRPLTTTSACGSGAASVSSANMVERAESTDWVDMLSNSLLSRSARVALLAHGLNYAPSGSASRRSPAQGVEYSPPTAVSDLAPSEYVGTAVRLHGWLQPTVVRVHLVVPPISHTGFEIFISS